MKRVITFLIFLLLIGLSSKAQINTERIDSIVKKAVENDLFEGTVLIAENGKSVYHKSIGFKDFEKLNPISKNTQFGIASITKLFTAIIIMQLVEEGKFKLSSNLKTLLPEYLISKSKKITLHHLLLHISGLPNEKDMIYSKYKTPEEFASETLSNKGNQYDQFNYANIDYVLLGIIIEKFNKKTWEESVQQRILNKLEMTNTGFLEKNNYPKDFAYSYSYDNKKLRQSDPLFFIENFYAAGCMYSTSEDLLKLDQGMYGSQLISPRNKTLMFTSYPEYNYSGYSVWTYNYPFAKSKPKIIERRGGILGANSVIIRMIETNKTIIILSNNNQFNPDSFGKLNTIKEALIIELDKSNG